MEQFISKLQADRSEIEVALFESNDKERIASMLIIRTGDSSTHISISAIEMRALALSLVSAAEKREIEEAARALDHAAQVQP